MKLPTLRPECWPTARWRLPAALQALAAASARMYPEFVHELQDESGMNVDLRDHGTILFMPPERMFLNTLNFMRRTRFLRL